MIEINDKRTNIEWTSYLASAYAEGFCEGEDATDTERIEAWSYLGRTGQAFQLQGFYGRAVMSLVDAGILTSDYYIDWDKFDELIEVADEM